MSKALRNLISPSKVDELIGRQMRKGHQSPSNRRLDNEKAHNFMNTNNKSMRSPQRARKTTF